MKKTTILLVWAALCLNFCAKAQNNQSLKVGDKVPASFWEIKVTTLNSRGELKEISLGDYKGKGVLIDFWACWCGSCIVKLPLMDSLQAKFASRLKILPVNSKITKDTHTRIQDLLSGKTHPKYKLSIPTVVDDEIIANLFPHNAVPHYVWINQSGVVKAITLSFMVREESLRQMLEEEQ